MPNRREFDHIGAYHFRVEIEGVTQGAFIAVSGLEGETEVIEFKDGHDQTVRTRPGRTRFSNIVLQRGYTANPELYDWYNKVTRGQIERKAGSVILLDDTAQEIQRFNFFEAWPCRWRGCEFHGDDATVLFEEIELVVERIERG